MVGPFAPVAIGAGADDGSVVGRKRCSASARDVASDERLAPLPIMVSVSETELDRDDRLRVLVGAGIALSSALSLDELLERLVRIAAELTGARYAALGVIDRDGDGLERFITHGIGSEEVEAIGALPRGGGVLGVLIRNVETLRLRSLGDDPRSVGFPPSHPPMRTFLGVPVVLRGVATATST